VCIHQTDLEKKKRGIDGLGGFLARSRYMVLLWDRSYFTRLWCVLELAAMRHLAGSSANIVVLPIIQGPTVVLGILGCAFINLILLRGFAPAVLLVTTLAFFALIARVAGRHKEDCAIMRGQLESFTCEQAECSCCSNQHRDPDSGVEIPCDRTVIYRAIEEWFGSRDNFDHAVHELYPMVRQRMGPLFLNFGDMFQLSLPVVWMNLGNGLLMSWQGFFFFCRFLIFSVCNFLLVAAFLLRMGGICAKRSAKWCRWIHSIVVGLLAAGLLVALNLFFRSSWQSQVAQCVGRLMLSYVALRGELCMGWFRVKCSSA